MVPTMNIRMMTKMLRARSAPVRPTKTAERVTGNDAKRSSNPLFRSVASPTPAASDPNTTVCTKMPGIRKSTYGMLGGRASATTPPNTYRNINTKMIGWIVENTRSCGTRL